MKKLLLSLLAVAGAWTSAFALDDEPAWKNDWTNAPANGSKFYLYNTAADGFIKGNMAKGSSFVSATDAGLWTKNNKNVSTQLDGKTYYLKMDTDEAFTNETNNNSWARNYSYSYKEGKFAITASIVIYDCCFYNKDGVFSSTYFKNLTGAFSGDPKYEWFLINETQYANHMAYVTYYNEAVNAKTVDATDVSKAWRDKHLFSFKFKNISETNQVEELEQLTNEIKAWEANPEEYALLKDDAVCPAINGLTHIDIERAIKAGTWNTLCLPFSMPIPTGWEVKYLSGVTYENGAYDAQFTEATSIEAGVPYIVKVENAETEIVYNNNAGFSLSDDISPVQVYTEDNAHSLTFIGVFEPQDLKDCYFISGGKFYHAAAGKGNTTKAYRAIFYTDTPASSAQLIYTVDEGALTLIDAPELIDNSAAPVFDMQGRRVNNPVSGQLYMKNGKKFIQK